MPKTINSALLAEMYKKSSVIFDAYELRLADDYYRYINNNEDVGVYTACAIKRRGIRLEEGTVISDIEIGLDNADLGFRSMIMNGRLDGRLIRHYYVFADANGTYIDQFLNMEGYIDAPKGDEHWVTITVRPFSVLERKFPRRVFQVNCNWTFCDTFCGLTITSYQTNTTLGSQSDGLTLSAATGQADDYFNPGFVKLMSGDMEGQVRPVLSNTSGSIVMRVPFDSTIAAGTSIRIQKLCDKTTTTCEDEFANYDNFGGFPFVPKQPIL